MRGLGSLITVRRSLGFLDMGTLVPLLVGGGTAALTALGIRWFVDPNQGTTQQTLVKWANLFGLGVGSLASVLWMMIGGGRSAGLSFMSAGVVAGFGLASDLVLKERAAPILASIASSGASMMPPPGTAGVGAIVPEYSRNGMGAIVMEQMGPGGRRPGSIGSYGDEVTLRGVNVGAFGTPAFRS